MSQQGARTGGSDSARRSRNRQTGRPQTHVGSLSEALTARRRGGNYVYVVAIIVLFFGAAIPPTSMSPAGENLTVSFEVVWAVSAAIVAGGIVFVLLGRAMIRGSAIAWTVVSVVGVAGGAVGIATGWTDVAVWVLLFTVPVFYFWYKGRSEISLP